VLGKINVASLNLFQLGTASVAERPQKALIRKCCLIHLKNCLRIEQIRRMNETQRLAKFVLL